LCMNENMTNQPESIIFKGRGIFTSGNCRVESHFIIQRQFSHTVFLIQEEDSVKTFFNQFTKSDPWSLSGQLEDGRPISSDQLMIARIEGSKELAEFSPLTGVVIGRSNSSPLMEAQYPLVGMFDGKFSIEDSEWTIEVLESDQNAIIAERRSKAWQLPLEGLTLRLATTQKTLDEYHEKAREVMLLLSLATGNGVTSYRQFANWGPQGMIEVWRKMTGDEIGPGHIIPTFRLGQFLKQALPVWKQLKSEQKSDARLAITYINLSATGYLDTRLFLISQAWEFLAKSWMPEGKLNDLESDLRTRIKSSYREWKKEHPKADPKGCWGGRVTFPFKWPIAKRQMESLAGSGKIALSKIGLDLEVLKKARDSVAHTGKMINQMTLNRNDTLQLLAAAQFGLQLVLIAELGYSGLVVTSNEGWKSNVLIEKFLKEEDVSHNKANSADAKKRAAD